MHDIYVTGDKHKTTKDKYMRLMRLYVQYDICSIFSLGHIGKAHTRVKAMLCTDVISYIQVNVTCRLDL